MKKQIVTASLRYFNFVALLIVVLSTNAIAQWTEVTLPRIDPLNPLLSVEWPDSSTGYVFDVRGYYYKTTDGGVSWKVDSLKPMPYNDISIRPFKGFTVRYVDFLTRDFGIVSLENFPQMGLDTLIYVTTDGGIHWENKIMKLLNPLNGLTNNGYYSVIRPYLSQKLYLFYYSLLDTNPAISAEVVYYSSDLGDTWKNIANDTLGNGDAVSAKSFILIDSLHQYKFYHWHHVDGENSWVKMTTNGGKTWIRIRGASHPLAEQYYQGIAFRDIHTVGDTGISITMYSESEFPPGRNYGMTTRDIRYMDLKQGWTGFTLPWFGSSTSDLIYQDGYMYALTISDAPVGLTDTTWIVDTRNGKIRGLLSPIGRPFIIPSSRDVIWAIQRPIWYNKIFKLDRRLVSVDEAKEPPETGSLRVYPNPFGSATNSGNPITSISFTLPESQHVLLFVIDLLGREVALLVNKEETDGNHVVEFNGDGLPSGVYQLVLMAGEKVVTLKMNLVK